MIVYSLVVYIYRSPSSSRDNNIKLNHLLQHAIDLKDTHIFIAGDFNYGNLNWKLQQFTENFDH